VLRRPFEKPSPHQMVPNTLAFKILICNRITGCSCLIGFFQGHQYVLQRVFQIQTSSVIENITNYII
jgi:hypothetical protein